MSDFYTTCLSLDCPGQDAAARVSAVREILAAQGYREGSAATGRGVEYTAGWHVADAGGSLGPASCPSCGHEVDDYMELVGTWFATREEPALACPSCGHASLLGDWFGPDGESGVFATHASVTLWNSPAPGPDVLTAVEAALGPRTREIHGRL